MLTIACLFERASVVKQDHPVQPAPALCLRHGHQPLVATLGVGHSPCFETAFVEDEELGQLIVGEDAVARFHRPRNERRRFHERPQPGQFIILFNHRQALGVIAEREMRASQPGEFGRTHGAHEAGTGFIQSRQIVPRLLTIAFQGVRQGERAEWIDAHLLADPFAEQIIIRLPGRFDHLVVEPEIDIRIRAYRLQHPGHIAANHETAAIAFGCIAVSLIETGKQLVVFLELIVGRAQIDEF